MPKALLKFLLFLLVVAAMPAQAQSTGGNYVVNAGDTLNIQVFGEPDLSFDSLPILDNGSISMPLIGEVRASGKTLDALESEIRSRLADGYLVNPNVTVTVSGYRPVFVVGEVRSPGSIAYVPGLTVRRAIALAGGLTDAGDPDKLLLERANSGNPSSVSEAIEVRPGDILTIGSIDTYSVRGAVQYPGSLRFQQGMTLAKALELAGGLADDADVRNIKLERGGAVFDVAGQQDSELLRPGDVLTVGKLSRVEVEEATQYFFVQGEVTNRGRFEYSVGMTVEKAIVLAGGFGPRASRRKVDIRREGDPPITLRRVELTAPVLPGDIISVGTSIF